MPPSAASSPRSSPVWVTPLATRLVILGNMDIRLGNVQPADMFLKVLQRIYKYGGQPFARDYLALHYGTDFDKAFGKGTGKAIMHATAGR
jgi:hypothetical protein